MSSQALNQCSASILSAQLARDTPTELASALLPTCMETLNATGRTRYQTVRLGNALAWVDADPTRVEQIISNLLDNVFKYTAPGGLIVITAGVDVDEAMPEVYDSGVGTAPDLLPHGLTSLCKARARSIDRAQGGTGIGLALVHQLFGLHDGSIAAYNEGAGCGSRFVLRLPQAAKQAASLVRVARAYAPPADSCALIVEDNEDGREMMAMLPESFGTRVLQAADSVTGLAAAGAHFPNIALVDIGLPGMDGYEVARQLRADPATRGIRLVALTGYGLLEDQKRALEAGFDLHLVKPVPPSRLRRGNHFVHRSPGF